MLELTGWCPHGDSLAHWGPKTPNNMGSSCEKKYDHRRFLSFHFFITLSPFETTGRKQCSWTSSQILKFFHLIWLLDTQNIIQIFPDTLQTHSRHTLDTSQTRDSCLIISNKTILRYSTNGKCNLNQHIFVINVSWRTREPPALAKELLASTSTAGVRAVREKPSRQFGNRKS